MTFAETFLNITYKDDDLVHQVTGRDHPGLKLWTIAENGGKTVESKFTLAGAVSYADTLSNAQLIAGTTPSGDHYAWQVPYAEMEGSIVVPYRDTLQSRNSNEAAGAALEIAVDDGLSSYGQRICNGLLGATNQAQGLGSYSDNAQSPAPVFSVLFNDPADARNFERGKYVIGSTNSDGSSPLTGTGVVVQVDTDDGWIQLATTSAPTTPADPGSWGSPTTSDVYIFDLGLVSDSTKIVQPMGSYLPLTRATDTYLNVNRARDSRLSAHRLSAAERRGDYASRIKRLVAKIVSRGANVKMNKLCGVMNPEDFAVFDEQVNGQVVRSPAYDTEEGFSAIKLNTTAGPLEIYCDPSKGVGSVFIVSRRYLRLFSIVGKNSIVQMVRNNGSITRLKDATNDLELRPISGLANVIGNPAAYGVVHLN